MWNCSREPSCMLRCDSHLALSCCSSAFWPVGCSPCKHASQSVCAASGFKEVEAADLAAKHLIEDEEHQQARAAAKQAKKQSKKSKTEAGKAQEPSTGTFQHAESSVLLLELITSADAPASVQHQPCAASQVSDMNIQPEPGQLWPLLRLQL